MTFTLLSPIVIFGAILVVPFVLVPVAIRRFRSGTLSRAAKTLWLGAAFVASLPAVGFMFLLLWFAAVNFPFTSGVLAQASSPNGEEACVVQTFKGWEPYQVSLYARRSGQPWMWHCLAHQDIRWRDCRVEFTGGELRVYTGAILRKTFSVSDATSTSDSAHEELPASYTPEQILARHDEYYRR